MSQSERRQRSIEWWAAEAQRAHRMAPRRVEARHRTRRVASRAATLRLWLRQLHHQFKQQHTCRARPPFKRKVAVRAVRFNVQLPSRRARRDRLLSSRAHAVRLLCLCYQPCNGYLAELALTRTTFIPVASARRTPHSQLPCIVCAGSHRPIERNGSLTASAHWYWTIPQPGAWLAFVTQCPVALLSGNHHLAVSMWAACSIETKVCET